MRYLDSLKRDKIIEVLKLSFTYTDAAKTLGLSRGALMCYRKKWGIPSIKDIKYAPPPNETIVEEKTVSSFSKKRWSHRPTIDSLTKYNAIYRAMAHLGVPVLRNFQGLSDWELADLVRYARYLYKQKLKNGIHPDKGGGHGEALVLSRAWDIIEIFARNKKIEWENN